MVAINPNLVPPSFYNPETGALKLDQATAEKVQAGIQAKLDELPPVGDQEMLRLIQGLAPEDLAMPGKLAEKLDAFAAAAANHQARSSDSPVIGDTSRFLALAIIQQAGQQRQQAADDRQAARASAAAELLSQAEHTAESAKQLMTGAITNLVIGSLGAGLSLAGSLSSAAGQAKALGKMSEASKEGAVEGTKIASLARAAETPANLSRKATATNRLNEASQSFAMAEKAGGLAQTRGQVLDGLGGMMRSAGAGADGIMQAKAKNTEAEGMKDAANAQYFQQVADGKKEIETAMKDLANQGLAFLKEKREADADAMRSITKG